MFLLCSSFAWFLSKLSEPYTSRTTFTVEYKNVPDSLLLTSVSKKNIYVRLKASGFKFLGFSFSRQKVVIDLSSLEKNASSFFVPPRAYQNQIENQLPNTMELSGIDKDTLFFKFQKIISKKVPVISKVDIGLVQNHLLEDFKISPDSITVSGPESEINNIKFINTEVKVLPELTSAFSNTIKLKKDEALKNTTLSKNNVKISGIVFRFSEKIIKIPVEVINVPNDIKIKTFPNIVSVLCRAKLNILKNIKVTDFQLVADYSIIKDSNTSVLSLRLMQKPAKIHSVDLMESEVEYILKRE